MLMETITLQVEADVGTLKAKMDEIIRNAQSRGLTAEILETILAYK
jgi:uncharacterized protein (UPF0335 family)